MYVGFPSSSYADFVASVEGSESVSLKTYEGSVFIIPNKFRWLQRPTKKDEGPDAFFSMWGCEDLFKGEGEFVLCMNAWAISPDCENWGSDNENKVPRFPADLPVDYFLGKKEGDVVTITRKEQGIQLVLTCKQKGYRYEGSGTFDETMEKLISFTYKDLHKDHKEKGLSPAELKQLEIINQLKAQYYPNLQW